MNSTDARPTGRNRRSRGRVLAWVAGGALAGVLAGCGIAPTDVIDAGEPATGVRSPGQTVADVQLFFYGPSGLRSAARSAKGLVDPEAAIQLLMEGPNHAERMRGLSSALPKFPGPVTAEAGKGTVRINLPMNVKLLDPGALNQLVCTAANARVPGNRQPDHVVVTVGDGTVRLGPLVCGGNNAFPVVQPTPTGTPPSGTAGGVG
ncbi:hypothetical protein [Streptomyces sp. NPDC020742]|uniref:hypothetical protein n=1 Tax=unclassified Streptomyces TaxID=2593676 RepID=UPI0034019F97